MQVSQEYLLSFTKKITGFIEATEIRTCACTGGEAVATSQLLKEEAAARRSPSWQPWHLPVKVTKTTGRAEISR